MKKVTAIILSVMLFASLLLIPSFSEAPAERTNYMKDGWKADYFAGTITETEEDGYTVYEYIPEAALSWFSPTLSLYQDLKDMMGDKNGITFILTFEVQGVFTKEGLSANPHILVRAVNPRTGGIAWDAEQVASWDEEGNSWSEIFRDTLEGDVQFVIESQNNYAHFAEEVVEINGTEWTRFELEPLYVSASDLNDKLFGDWLFCFDSLDYNPSFKGLRIRNTAIYDYGEGKPTKAPTEEPTEAPTAAPTDVPVKTDAPTGDKATAAPTAKATEKPKDGDTEQEGNKPNVGLIIGIVCGVIAVAAVIVVVVMKKKKAGDKAAK